MPMAPNPNILALLEAMQQGGQPRRDPGIGPIPMQNPTPGFRPPGLMGGGGVPGMRAPDQTGAPTLQSGMGGLMSALQGMKPGATPTPGGDPTGGAGNLPGNPGSSPLGGGVSVGSMPDLSGVTSGQIGGADGFAGLNDSLGSGGGDFMSWLANLFGSGASAV